MPANDSSTNLTNRKEGLVVGISGKEISAEKFENWDFYEEEELNQKDIIEESFEKAQLISLKNVFKFETLLKIHKVLKKGSLINIQQIVDEKHSEKDLLFDLVKAGFVDSVVLKNQNGKIEMSANKPQWKIGSSLALKLNKKPATSVWNIASTESMEEDLEDENNLLSEEDLKVKKQKKDDCEITGGQRKACKNCSCGRKEGTSTIPEPQFKEQQEEEKKTETVKSSCGNCYLGDAFRCSGCPYLGKPAFKAGEVVALDLQDDI